MNQLSRVTISDEVHISVFCFAYSAESYNADDFVKTCREGQSEKVAQFECLARALGAVSEQQMSISQYMYIGKTIIAANCQPICNVLVFGVGGDSPMWMFANRRQQVGEFPERRRKERAAIAVAVH